MRREGAARRAAVGLARVLALAAGALADSGLSAQARAQEPVADALAAVPRFPIAASPIGLEGDVRRGAYLGAIGRRAAWLGREDGEAEIWVHPLEVVDRFRLDFRIPDYVDPVRGEEVARTVSLRPELSTITYAHATFTVRQHVLAPLDEPGILVLLEVETFQPLEIVVSFRSVLQYAWPGSLGGQYAFWSPERRAFVLSESLQGHNAVVGSPWASEGSSHPAHALPDAPSTFLIPVDTARARREFIPIAAAAGIAPRDSAFARYERLLAEAGALYEEKRAWADSLLRQTVALDTPDDRLDLAFRWAIVNLAEGLACNPDLGCGLVAGWGPSGESHRPGFGWFFGGDAAINSIAMDLAGPGLWPAVAEGLRFLARHQREDGKIPHEVSQAAGRIPWFTDFPYTYYHADTTPYWIVALWRYWRATNDDALRAELWPAARRAFEWCRSADTDGDAIVENTAGGLGAVEVGALGEEIHQDIYLAAVWIEALKAMEELAGAAGDPDLAAAAAELGERARATLEGRYWREDAGHYAFGILASGRTNDVLTVWPATAAAFGLLRPDRAERTLAALASDRISADWGARMLSRESGLYHPMQYNQGTVWPFVTGFASWGQYAYRRPWAGFPPLAALARITFDWARGRHAELFSGSFYRPLDTAVPHQLFASSMLVTPVLAGLFGWEPDAPRGRARLSPQLPPGWDRARVEGLRAGEARLDLTFERGPIEPLGPGGGPSDGGGGPSDGDAGARSEPSAELRLTIDRTGPPVTLDLELSAPAGAADVSLEAPGAERARPETTAVPPRGGPRETRVRRTFAPPEGRSTARLSWSGGLEVEGPASPLEPGQRSEGLRVLDFRYAGDAWILSLEGSPGREYELGLRGEPVRPAADTVGAEVVAGPEGRQRLRIRFAAEGEARSGRSARTVRLVRAGSSGTR